jgi:protein-disulfide isomerase
MKMGKKLAVPVNESDHAKGPADAVLELVEYGDYECPYCGQAFGIVSRLLETFGEDLRYVFRNFPIPELHPRALDAAKAAEAAALQRRFWPMHKAIYENQNSLDQDSLLGFAEEIGLNLNQFERAMKSPTVMRHIDADINGANQSGVTSTPAFFINGRKYEGDWSYESLHDVLEALRKGESLEGYFKAA